MYRYTTITKLRAQGFAIATMSNERADELIVEASQYLTDVLGQWFTPIRVKKKVSGGGANFLVLPNRIPLLEIFALQDTFTGPMQGTSIVNRAEAIVQGNLNYASDDWFIVGRKLRLKYSSYYNGRDNIVLDAYTGLLDNFTEQARNDEIRKIVSSSLATLALDGTTVVLDSVEGLEVRDVVLFESNDTARDILGEVIITEIDRATKTITFDPVKPINDTTIPSGSRTVVFGKVPSIIEKATIILVKQFSILVGSNDYDDSVLQGQIKTERTDGYSYTLFGSGDGGGMGITGDPRIDRQLYKFSEPNHVDIV